MIVIFSNLTRQIDTKDFQVFSIFFSATIVKSRHLIGTNRNFGAFFYF